MLYVAGVMQEKIVELEERANGLEHLAEWWRELGKNAQQQMTDPSDHYLRCDDDPDGDGVRQCSWVIVPMGPGDGTPYGGPTGDRIRRDAERHADQLEDQAADLRERAQVLRGQHGLNSEAESGPER